MDASGWVVVVIVGAVVLTAVAVIVGYVVKSAAVSAYWTARNRRSR
jgi:hypothetical protein